MGKSGIGKAWIRAVAWPTAAVLVLLASIVGGILHFSTSESDRLAVERQNRRVTIAIEQGMRTIANDQEASTYWDDAVLRTRERPLNQEWLDNNLGTWFHTYYGHDETYLLDPRNAAVYAMQNGHRAQPATFQRIATPAVGIAQSLRKQLALGYLAPEGAEGRTVGSSEIAMINGHPAIISMKPIVSETGNIVQRPGSEYLHISVRYLDGSFLGHVGRVYGIDKPRFTPRAPGPAALPVRDRTGATLGYLSWKPFKPGKQVQDRMMPVLLVSLLGIGLLVGFLLTRIWRSRTELEASRAQAQHLAFHDSLTGLPNRALFEDRLDHALSRRGRHVALLLLDLDRFKNVNDTLGHQAGDALIREFGMRLSTLTRDGDTISRLGGDEFAILMDEGRDPEVHRLARRILEDISRPFEILGAQIHIGVSIGIAMAGDSPVDRLELVRKADIALYRAKDAGRNDYRLFSPDMDANVKLRGSIEEELRDALATGKGLTIHYQPQVGSAGEIVGLEALLRWDHPMRGLIAPEQFVPIAEETGLIVPLGEWVFRQACIVSRRWPGLFMAFNLSPIQFRSSGFFESLMRIVRTTGAKPASIQLEVTERVLLDDDDSAKAVLARLREEGFAIVLDDFGTGYSSLSYLRKFEVDKIKIDRSFVQHLGDAADSGAIVTAVLALGHAMGLSVSAEGVETAAQQAFLKVAGCTEMQGFYFSRALPLDELAELLKDGNFKSAAA